MPRIPEAGVHRAMPLRPHDERKTMVSPTGSRWARRILPRGRRSGSLTSCANSWAADCLPPASRISRMMGKFGSRFDFWRKLCWRVVREDLFQRPPAEIVLLPGRTLAQFSRQHPAADFSPELHAGSHSRASLRRSKTSGLTPRSSRRPGLHICALSLSTAAAHTKRCRFQPPSTAGP